MKNNISVVELFAGVGGFRLGLENASNRFKTVWANQWEPGLKNQFAFDCYNNHYGDSGSVNVNEDIALVQDQVPNHNLLVGGFPCQDYSVAATKTEGIKGKKGVLWWNIDYILRKKKPKLVILENVDRLLKSPSSQRGRDFGVMLKCFYDIGYDVEWRVINAAEYGEVQRRRRVFIFASLHGEKYNETVKNDKLPEIVTKTGFFTKDFPMEEELVKNRESEFSIGTEKYSDLLDVSNNFSAQFYRAGVMRNGVIYTRDYLSAWKPESEDEIQTLESILEPDIKEEFYINDKKELEKWKYMKGPKRIERIRRDTGFKYIYTEGGISFPDKLDAPGRTMLTTEGTANRSSHLIKDSKNGRYRKLTPVECERLNGFPDNWTEGMSNRNRYFTMGNALVVPLITKMGKRILDYSD